ncbi:MFS transporter [Pseudomonas fluorescens]|uniref:MFS transporter n=1 Tax=Pseudomonas fluorescens TaxID=294 RepID=A0A5E7EJX5_PSEFL|nr:MFS transporter [Pseudomonas fluorescens]VVO27039.1 hypothetical protein PS723_04684 [Pseudomonas fluorescens]
MPSTSAGLSDTRTLGRFILLSTLAGAGVGVAKVSTSLYALFLNASPLELGLIAGAQTGGLLLTSLLCGVLVERLGPLRLFCLGSASAAALYVLVGQAHSCGLLMLITLLIGLCMPCRFVSLNTVFMQQLASMAASRAGWFRGSQMAGVLLLGPALAAVLNQQLGPAGVWPVVALVFALPLLLAPWVLNIYPAQRQAAAKLSLSTVFGQLSLLRHDPILRRNSQLDFCVQAAAMYFAYFIVAITVQNYGWSPSQAAALLSAHGLAYIFALFFLGRHGERLSPRRLLGYALACGSTLLVLGLAQGAWTLSLGAIGLGLSLGLLQIVTLFTYAQCGVRLGHGRVAGVAALVGPAGSLSGCLIGGLLGEVFALQHLFMLFIPLFVLLALLPTVRNRWTLFLARRAVP